MKNKQTYEAEIIYLKNELSSKTDLISTLSSRIYLLESSIPNAKDNINLFKFEGLYTFDYQNIECLCEICTI